MVYNVNYHNHAQMVEAPKKASGEIRVNTKLYEFPNKISCVDFWASQSTIVSVHHRDRKSWRLFLVVLFLHMHFYSFCAMQQSPVQTLQLSYNISWRVCHTVQFRSHCSQLVSPYDMVTNQPRKNSLVPFLSCLLISAANAIDKCVMEGQNLSHRFLMVVKIGQ